MNRIVTFLFLLACLTGAQAQDFYNINSVKDIRITFETEHWSNKLDALKYGGKKERMIGQLEINGIQYDSVGVRYKGNSSYFNVKKSDSPKLPFNIKINYVKSDQQLKGGHTTIKLSNIFRDPSYMREALSYEIARKYTPAPQANFARLYINNEYIGLYNNVESVDSNFLRTHFGSDQGFLVKCDPDNLGEAKKLPEGVKGCEVGDYASLDYVGSDSMCYKRLYEMKSESGWKELINLTQILEKSPDRAFKFLNVDQVLWMHAINNVLVNLDSYSGRLCHNYYLYRDTAGVFHPIIWDLNLSFGGFRFADAKAPLSNEEMQEMTPFLHFKNPERPLISKLLEEPLYRKVYLAHIHTILKDNFSNEAYLSRIRSMQQYLDFYVKNDEHKLYPYESFKANAETTALAGKTKIIGIKELMAARTTYLKAHPIMQKAPPTIATPTYAAVEDTLNFSVKVDGANAVYLAYRASDKGAFKLKPMFDDGEHKDMAAGDSYFGLDLPKAMVKHYYIIAEGEKVAQLSPERASWEFHEVR